MSNSDLPKPATNNAGKRKVKFTKTFWLLWAISISLQTLSLILRIFLGSSNNWVNLSGDLLEIIGVIILIVSPLTLASSQKTA